MERIVFISTVWFLLNIIVGAKLGTDKGRTFEGILLSVFLGPIGWLLIGIGKDYSKTTTAEDDIGESDASELPEIQEKEQEKTIVAESDITPQDSESFFDNLTAAQRQELGQALLNTVAAKLNEFNK